jgi:hypothetical protein
MIGIYGTVSTDALNSKGIYQIIMIYDAIQKEHECHSCSDNAAHIGLFSSSEFELPLRHPFNWPSTTAKP